MKGFLMTTQQIKNRQAIERRIVSEAINAGIKEGYTFIIYNGGDSDEEIKTTNKQETLSAMFATDEERLYLCKEGKKIGCIFFVYGNDGHDVICDYSTNLEELLTSTHKLADSLAR